MGTLFAHMSDFKHAMSDLTPPSMIKLLHATAPPIFPNSSQLDLLVHMMDRSCDMMPICVSMLAELANITGGNCSSSLSMMIRKCEQLGHDQADCGCMNLARCDGAAEE